MDFVFDYKDIEAVARYAFGSLDDMSYALAETEICFNLQNLPECVDIVDKAIAKACK